MSIYYPDCWVVLKLSQGYKVLAGWSGGYLDGDSWRMNSGITHVEEKDDRFTFYGVTGSLYVCYKGLYGLRMSNVGVYNALKEKYPDKVFLMPEDTDWMKMKWEIK